MSDDRELFPWKILGLPHINNYAYEKCHSALEEDVPETPSQGVGHKHRSSYYQKKTIYNLALVELTKRINKARSNALDRNMSQIKPLMIAQ